MIYKLKKRLVLLYGITSSIILTIIIAGAFFINVYQNQEQKKILFEKNVDQIVESIRSKNVISSAWIASMEMANGLYIYIEDGGRELTDFFERKGRVDSEKLITTMKELSLKGGISLEKKPFEIAVKKTPVYIIHQENEQSYLGMAALIPYENSWRNIMVFYYDKSKNIELLQQIILFAAIDLIGIAAFFLLSTVYINRILKPLSDGQKRQTAFIVAASHEFRSPLTVIKAGVATMKGDLTKTEMVLPHIEGECERMSRLISDMLFLASSDAKTWSLIKGPIDMDTLLIECYDLFCTLCNKNHNEITLDLPKEELQTIMGDKERLKQVLSILIDNAIYHTKEGTRINLCAYNQKNHVVIEVVDYGEGIPDSDKMHIFDRFYKGDPSRNDKRHFGLGLSIAKELIELHKGEIIIKDTIGGGATFVIRLPVL